MLRSIARSSAPPLRHSHPLVVMVSDLLDERTKGAHYPPGATRFSLRDTKRFFKEPRELLVECYERFGPVFTLRLFTTPSVFMLGPEANHHMTVSNAANFTIRESHFRDLVTMLGDGILTTDGDVHRRMRRSVLPAFHSESIAGYFEIMRTETQRALDAITPGEPIDINIWARRLVLRISMLALFGLDPQAESIRRSGVVEILDKGGAVPFQTRLVPGPFSPWARLMRALRELDRLIYAEIKSRRARGEQGRDVFSLLLHTRCEDGEPLTDVEIRDQLLTLLLSSHETTTSSTSFLLYELARHPDVADRIVAEQQAALDVGELTAEQLMGGQLPELEMALDETLRMYPATWLGPRRAVSSFELHGVTIPAGAYVNYCPLASHYLPDVFPQPERFEPKRFSPEAKAALPKGAYVPFGGGHRMCIGMRFAQLEIRTIVSLLLRRFELSPVDDFSLTVRPLPMLKPLNGIPVMVHERTRRSDLALAHVG
jgi:cytochrome P450